MEFIMNKIIIGCDHGGVELKNEIIAHLEKKNIALLKAYAKKRKAPATFLEIMTCPNGCITGPVAYNPDAIQSENIFNQALTSCKHTYADIDTSKSE